MSSRDERIGRNLVTLRVGHSQDSLAARMRERGHRWSQATVWSVESGQRPLRISEAVDIADVLGIDMEALARGAEQTEADQKGLRIAQAVQDAHESLTHRAAELAAARSTLQQVLDDAAQGREEVSDSVVAKLLSVRSETSQPASRRRVEQDEADRAARAAEALEVVKQVIDDAMQGRLEMSEPALFELRRARDMAAPPAEQSSEEQAEEGQGDGVHPEAIER